MKKYLIKLCIISSIFCSIILILIGIQAYQITHYSWKIPREKHIVFMGASHVARGIDDTVMKSAFNFARPSERYMYTYIKLRHLCEENPQIDTVFLECAHTDLAIDCDYKYFEENELSGYVELYWPLFSKENWSVLFPKIKEVFWNVLQGISNRDIYSRDRWFVALGKFEPLKGEMNKKKVNFKKKEGREYGHTINYHFLHEIIEYCDVHNIKLYLLQCPVYHPEYFFDDVYHKKALKQFAEKAEYLDFSQWPCEDREMLDPHHLNKKGAVRFSNELKKLYQIK